MTPSNFLVLWANLAVLAVAGLAATRIFRLRGSRGWLPYLQLLLIGCLLLPVLLPEREAPRATPADRPAAVDAFVLAMQPAGPAVPLPALRWDPERVLQRAIWAGIVVRCLWLLLGLGRLQYYRRRSTPLPHYSQAVRDALISTGAPAEFHISPTLKGPVTFGFLRPVVLLPAEFTAAPVAEQQAIATHEALHVSRKDWLVSVLEEAVATLLWFQPAVWLIVSEIRLAREQAVDRAAIALTNDRDGYVAALLSVARVAAPPDCALARPFLGRGHLFQRIQTLLKEDSMTRGRLIVSYAAAVVVAFVAASAVARALPLQVPARPEANPSVTVTPDGAVLHRSAMEYPDEARRAKVEGTVLVEVTPPSNGVPASARAISGHDMLREAAELSALRYLYQSPSLGAGRMAIVFRLPAPELAFGKRITGVRIGFSPTASRAVDQSRLQSFVGQILTLDKWNEIRDAAPDLGLQIDLQDPQTGQVGQIVSGPLTIQRTGPLQHVVVRSPIPEQTRSALIQRLQPYVGRQIDSQLMGDVYREVSAVSPDLRVSFGSRQVFVSAPAGQTPTEPAPQATTGQEPPKTIRVGGAVQAAKLVVGPPPVYPEEARLVRLQGVVQFDATIARDGAISQLTLKSGHPMLVGAAMEAVQRWRYQPTLLNGQPVEVQTIVEVHFTLPQ